MSERSFEKIDDDPLSFVKAVQFISKKLVCNRTAEQIVDVWLDQTQEKLLS